MFLTKTRFKQKFPSQKLLKHLSVGYSSNVSTNQDQYRAKIMARGLPKQRPIDGVKHIILVSSGKGGVGKTTTSVNLATALKINNPSKNIGLLDSDIYGPSVPLMMNLNETPLLDKHNKMVPLLNYGVSCMSMGFLVEPGAAVIWRGLMVMQALEKLLRQVAWQEIEYLIVDTPPGTGDTHLSLLQNVPISGVLLVTTPQIAALQVMERGAQMYEKLSVPILGIVENMANITCPTCSSKVNLFGGYQTEQVAQKLNVEILAKLPLNQHISNGCDKGVPIVVCDDKNELSRLYLELAEAVVNQLRK